MFTRCICSLQGEPGAAGENGTPGQAVSVFSFITCIGSNLSNILKHHLVISIVLPPVMISKKIKQTS